MNRRLLPTLLVLAAAVGPMVEMADWPRRGPFLALVGIAAMFVLIVVGAGGTPILGRGTADSQRHFHRRWTVVNILSAVGFLFGIVYGERRGLGSTPFLLLLIPAAARSFRRPTPGRIRKTIRDASLFAFGGLVILGSPAFLAGAVTVTLILAAALPLLHAEETARLAAGRSGGVAPVLRPRAVRSANWTVPATAVAAALLFVLFPRFGGGASEEPSAAATRRERATRDERLPSNGVDVTGMSRRVAIGDIGRLQRDFRPVLEVDVFRRGVPADAEDLGPLFRSGALEEFDGETWTSEDPSVLRRDPMDGAVDGFASLPGRRVPGGEPVEQRLRFLAGGTDSLFCLGIPTAVGGSAAAGSVRLLPRGEVRSAETYGEGAEFTIRSVAVPGDYALVDGESLTDARRERLLRLPPGHERAAAWARAGLAGAGGGARLLRRLEGMLRKQCAYSLDLKTTPGTTAVEGFLFATRQGHCELFASAAVVALRGCGVPARVAIGFRGGTYDSAAKRYTIRGADAHAWAEAWFEGEGWRTIDPTPSAGNPLLDAEGSDEAAADDGGAARRVLAYDAEAQRRFLLGVVRLGGDLLRNAFTDADGRPRLLVALAVSLALSLLAGALLLRRSVPAAAPPEAAARAAIPIPIPEAWTLLLGTLAAAGIRRAPTETAAELAERAVAAGAAPPEAVLAVAAAYSEERWGGRAPGAGARDSLRALAARVSLSRPS